MNNLQGKNIVIGITGGIAAYKTLELIRLLRKAQANVNVVLTPAASEFVTPLTIQALSGNPVHQSLLDTNAELAMGHIELAKWADAIVIAPASADFLARLRAGMANDLLSTICLATSSPLFIAPAMNQQMYLQQATQENLAVLKERNIQQIGPNNGFQACGDNGPGRMVEAEEILEVLSKSFIKKDLEHLKITITAGPTRESIDPVRFLTNHSSGKMGFAIAQAFAQRGAQVTLISGPVHLNTPDNVQRIDVITAQDMLQESLQYAVDSDIFIGCAAVADYRPAKVLEHKMKKIDQEGHNLNDTLQLELIKNPDIIANIASLNKNRPFVVGFAAETQELAHYAQDKLKRKNLDLICANDVSQGQAFHQDKNSLQLFWPQGQMLLPLTSKQQLAYQLVEQITQIYHTKERKH